tara:strand:- start:1176 stop:1679 length:504 start_codon:yes stop_codon:yes gene_type:complete
MILTNFKYLFTPLSKLTAAIILLVLVGCSSTPFMQNNIVATKYLLDNFVEDAGGKGQANAETYHWEVDASSLGCAELQAERIRHSALIDSVAEKVIENSSRSTSYASYGLEMHDPSAGTSFIGVKSTGLNPEVAEYRKLKLAVEKLKSASIEVYFCRSDENPLTRVF